MRRQTQTDRPSIRPFERDPADADIELAEERSSPPLSVAAGRMPADGMSLGHGARRTRWLWILGLAGLAGVLVMQTVASLSALFRESPWIGIPFMIFLGLIATASLGILAKEYRTYKSLARQHEIRTQAGRLAVSELHGEAQPLIDQLTARHRRNAGDEIAAFEAAQTPSLNDGEAVRLFERIVISAIDKRAHRIVLESSRDIGLLTALSPLGILDGFLVLWRTLLMTRQIAELYGLRPSPVAGLMLLRRSVRNAILAGVADIVSHAAVEHVGAGLLALLSARAGQGAGNALLAARFGIETIKQVRPLAFVEMPEPKLGDLRKALLEAPPSKQHNAA